MLKTWRLAEAPSYGLPGVTFDPTAFSYIGSPGAVNSVMYVRAATGVTTFDKLMDDPQRYLFKADRLEIVFNQYDVAAYVMGRYTVEIPYDRLTGLIRPDGPLAR